MQYDKNSHTFQIGGVDIPCGCGHRQHIMFDRGNPDATVALMVGIPLVAIGVIWYLKVRK